MKNLNLNLFVIASMLVAATAHARVEKIEIVFNPAVAVATALWDAGAKKFVGPVSTGLAIDNLDCTVSLTARGRRYACEFLQQVGIPATPVTKFEVAGTKARKIVDALEDAGVKPVIRMGGSTVAAREISCTGFNSHAPVRSRPRCTLTVRVN